MAQGALYPVYLRIPLYATADDAKAKTNISSYITPDGSEVEGPGTFYTDTAYNASLHAPARPLYFVHAQYGIGYTIGWVNDTENVRPAVVRVGTAGGVVTEGKEVWIGVYGGVAKAKEVYVGDANGKPRRAI